MDESPDNSVSILDHIRERGRTFYVQRWFADPERERGLVLDLPAGTMRETEELVKLGYKVISADLFLKDASEKAPDMSWLCADMTVTLPFPAGTFDYMVNSEGIEHIPDQFAFLKECARVVAPGGLLAVTTPNLLSTRARAAFMLAGNRAFNSFVDEETSVWGRDGNKIYHGHAFLINYFQLRYMLHHSGFEVQEVVGTHYSSTSMLLSPFLTPFIWLFTQWAMRKAKRKNPGSKIYDAISRDVFSRQMLLSKNLFVIARRREEADATPHEKATENEEFVIKTAANG